jgi:hypothetical protein
LDTFYSRHTMVIGIDCPTRERIWAEKLVAVHCPHNQLGTLPLDEDNCSLNSNDHSPAGKRRLNALHKLAQRGGYVYAEYWITDTEVHYVCGKVLPRSPIEFLSGTWGGRYGNGNRPTKLIYVRLTSVLTGVPKLRGVPVRSTLCQWHTIGTVVEDMFIR